MLEELRKLVYEMHLELPKNNLVVSTSGNASAIDRALGCIVIKPSGDYDLAMPYPKAIEAVNKLYEKGHRIELFTARFMGRCEGDAIKAREIGYEFTFKQLCQWGCKFHVLHMGKPVYDLIVDDRAIFFDDEWYLSIDNEITQLEKQ